jgi:hypothetical protein
VFKQVIGFTEGNCGCFVDILPMTNLESIIKNVIGMALGILVWVKFKKDHVFSSWVAPAFLGLITLFTLSFGVKSYASKPLSLLSEGLELAEIPQEEAMEEDSTKALLKETVVDETIITPPPLTKDTPKKVNKVTEGSVDQEKKAVPVVQKSTPSDKTLQLLYTYAPAIESQNLAYGSKLVCLFSMTCSHCQEVYADLVAMKASRKLPDLYLVNYGTEYEQNYFFSQAGNVQSPHTRTEEFSDFKRMLEGKTYPRILYVKEGKILKEWDVDTYEKVGFMKYFSIEKLEEKKSGGLQLEIQDGTSPW